MTRKTAKRFSPELRERAVRRVQDREREGGTQWESAGAIAAKIGCSRETLRRRVRRGERDVAETRGVCGWVGDPGWRRCERERFRALAREVRELRQVNESLRKASASLAEGELDRPFKR